jgi:cytochrome P450
VRSHQRIQSNEGKVLTHDLIRSASDYVLSIERYATSTASIIGWGRRIKAINDPVGQVALAFMECVDYVIPGLFIMETVPILAKLPGWIYPLPSKILGASKLMQRYFVALAREGALAVEDNFSKRLIAAKEDHGIMEEDILSLTANLIGGAVDTTTSTICSFILAMCVFPDVQRRAQQELDQIVGQNRSPDWCDEDKLPYVKAIISETLRWRTATVLAGAPHAPIQDDVFNGYFIPKGTSITASQYIFLR